MNHVFLVGVGGFIGSVLRYFMSGLAYRWSDSGFPYGTMAVNFLGCLAAGVIWSLSEYREWLSPEMRILLTVGILGGFTTFSAFGHEMFLLIRSGHHGWALANIVGNVVLGIGAVVTGWTAVKILAA